MKRIPAFERSFWKETEGVTAIEYALLASLIAVAILGGVLAVGSAVNDLWTKVSNCVANPSSCT